MIRLLIHMPGKKDAPFVWHADVINIGRLPVNDLSLAAENISSRHGRVILRGSRYYYEDLGSTNGSVVLRADGEVARLGESGASVELAEGDKICLASMDNCVEVVQILLAEEESSFESENQTILAEASAHDSRIEETLGGDFDALRCAVELSRAIVEKHTEDEIGDLACSTFLRAFTTSNRAMFLEQERGQFVVRRFAERYDEDGGDTLNRCPQELLNRCLREGKGFIFMLQGNEVKAIATMIMSVEAMGGIGSDNNVAIMCCPLFHNEKCYGFMLVEAPITDKSEQVLGRRDLSLGTLMAAMIAGRLADLADTRERLTLARKATAGFMAAMVGHCFKNLLFVPMSISKMLPMCIKAQQWDEVNHMLMRNLINIRYLDVLSNEFANASKALSEGFELFDVRVILDEAAQLVNQVSPDKIEGTLVVPDDMPEVLCHPAAIKRLIMNLTLNAVDAIVAQKGRSEKGRVELALDYNPENTQGLVMHIRDNGPGMPEEIADNLRDIYQRIMASADALGELQTIAEEVRSTKDQGLKEHYGLGFLFVCQTIHQHGGQLLLTAEQDIGTFFMIKLPVKTAPMVPAQ